MNSVSPQGEGSVHLVCDNESCRRPVRRVPSKVKPYNFCSRACQSTHSKSNPSAIRTARGTAAPRVEMKCGNEQCSNTVIRRKSQMVTNVFCSKACFTNNNINKTSKMRGRKRAGRPVGSIRINIDGYIEEKTDDGWVLQHRYVMEKMLNRSLTPLETVHHKNAIRHDNRENNLELWAGVQPTGARVKDLVEYARYIESTYGKEYDDSMYRSDEL